MLSPFSHANALAVYHFKYLVNNYNVSKFFLFQSEGWYFIPKVSYLIVGCGFLGGIGCDFLREVQSAVRRMNGRGIGDCEGL